MRENACLYAQLRSVNMDRVAATVSVIRYRVVGSTLTRIVQNLVARIRRTPDMVML